MLNSSNLNAINLIKSRMRENEEGEGEEGREPEVLGVLEFELGQCREDTNTLSNITIRDQSLHEEKMMKRRGKGEEVENKEKNRRRKEVRGA